MKKKRSLSEEVDTRWRNKGHRHSLKHAKECYACDGTGQIEECFIEHVKLVECPVCKGSGKQ